MESLADKCWNLARELSRTFRSASVSQLHQHGHGLSPSSPQHGSASSSLAPALRRAVSDLPYSAHPESEWEREASLNTSFTYTLPFGNGLPASVEVPWFCYFPAFIIACRDGGSIFTSVLASSASSSLSPSSLNCHRRKRRPYQSPQ